ncbi:hypothetical protein KI387_033263 [Taxus chinensis]|uniref:TIR domain-containing protein n=1 Tax=Taxus chinensis TaxID=29808 RepID=A0AA38BS02_TAXCH|nr:hypothetical protein KI387_033263 [Taxus chinensis]
MEISSSVRGKEKEIPKIIDVNAMPEQKFIPRGKYDIFVSHSRSDKSSVASILYDELVRSGLKVFLDEKKDEMNDILTDSIQEAISNASLHIPILSKQYAESYWCLNELSFMFKTGAPILPIYYDIQPSDLLLIMKAEGINSKNYSRYAMKGTSNTQKHQECTEALHKVSLLSGHVFNIADSDMEKVQVKNIVKSVLNFIWIDANPVGLDEAVGDIEKTISQSGESVKFVGIVGIEGSGKTTLAEELYKRKSTSFEESCFLYGVKDIPSNGLYSLQNEVLKNLSVGKKLLKDQLKDHRFLVILDDIDHKDQMDALLPLKKLVGAGSLIVITTRYIDILSSSGIYSVYEMGRLDQSHAEQLFCWHAFRQANALHGFEGFVELFSSNCNGVPLSLKRIGQELYGRSKDVWETQLARSSGILFKDVKNSTKKVHISAREAINTNSINKEIRTCGLQVLVIKGKESDNLTAELLLLRWYDCPYTSLPSWASLENLRVLDLLNVFFNELWSHNVKPPTQLRMLKISGSIAKIPKSIRQLQDLETFVVDGWVNTSLKALPEEFCDLLSLKHLTLRWCRSLRSLPTNFGKLTNLQHLNLSFCSELRVLPHSFRELIKLEYIDFESCRNLEIEPYFLGQISTLEHMSFKDCRELRVLPAQVPHQVNLKTLNLVGTSLQEIPTEMGKLISLEVLELGSPYLRELPISLGNMRNLTILNVKGCSSLKPLPDSVLLLTKLKIDEKEKLKPAPAENDRRGKYISLTKKRVAKSGSFIRNMLLNRFNF